MKIMWDDVCHQLVFFLSIKHLTRCVIIRGWNIFGVGFLENPWCREIGHGAQQNLSNTTLHRFTAMRYSYLCLIDCIGGGCCVSFVNFRNCKVRKKVFDSLPDYIGLQNYICQLFVVESSRANVVDRFFRRWNIGICQKNYWEIAG